MPAEAARHPLMARGYRSIGCAPRTHAIAAGAPPRAGRWAGTGKTEGGIHTRAHTPTPPGSPTP
ncbi:MAG: hypothetical protein BGP12_06780 [Rhodospirillales bacterium 70-18]|nr:MAG: hypothetical protein BGP12_06780 [Rhodospirillales bacterium 70-18]